MIELLGAFLGQVPAEPPPLVWYHQAVACAASAGAAKAAEPSAEEAAELLTWGFVIADAGRKAGRTREQVDSEDLGAALEFSRMMKEKKPAAFEAHRAYCRALLP